MAERQRSHIAHLRKAEKRKAFQSSSQMMTVISWEVTRGSCTVHHGSERFFFQPPHLPLGYFHISRILIAQQQQHWHRSQESHVAPSYRLTATKLEFTGPEGPQFSSCFRNSVLLTYRYQDKANEQKTKYKLFELLHPFFFRYVVKTCMFLKLVT